MNTFIKLPDSLTCIPEISKFYTNPAFHILMVLLRHIYHSDVPAYNNRNHRTAVLAERHLRGEAVALFSNSMLSEYTGFSRDAVIRGIDLLEKLKLVEIERFGQKGTIYHLGTIDKTNNTLSTYLMRFGEEAETIEGAKKVQGILMHELGIKAERKEIYNISFKSNLSISESLEKSATAATPRAKRKKWLKEVDGKAGHWIHEEAFNNIVDSVCSKLSKYVTGREKIEKIMKKLLESDGKDVLHRFEFNLKEIQIDAFHLSEIRKNYGHWLLNVANGNYSKAQYASD